MQTASEQPIPDDAHARTSAQWREQYERLFPPNYGERRLAIVRGAGTRVWDAEGNAYLDFVTGISVNNLGHCHPRVTAAIRRQAETLVHCSNLYYIPVQIELARRLVDAVAGALGAAADDWRVFFANSGAEANEAAIKLARRALRERHGPGRHEILCTDDAFHGRTLATLTATGKAALKEGFEPLVEGFRHAPLNDLGAMERAVGDATGAIMIELIQGEAGIRPADAEYVAGLRRLCDARGLLLIVDEVQTGLGRTGKLLACEHYGARPDILTLAKSLGGGLAMGAMLCRADLAGALAPGSHGTTMGGNPLTAAAAKACLDELIEGDWATRAAENGAYLRERIEAALAPTGRLREIRGMGLMLGIELDAGAKVVLAACEARGLLINAPSETTIRLLPPLNITREEIDEAVGILAEAVKSES